MKSRFAALATAFVALCVVMGPVIADELMGVITKVDVPEKKITVSTKKGAEEVIVKVTDKTEILFGKNAVPGDLEKIEKAVKKAQEANKKGAFAKITHEDKTASKILIGVPKKAQ